MSTDGEIPERQQSRLRAAFAFIFHEPLFHFLVLGLVIWFGSDFWKAHFDRYTIKIGLADRERIATNYSRQFGQPPTKDQLQQLLDRAVREEIYLREGKALQLEVNDEIVRRRIVQKYEFLQTDVTVPDAPKVGQLRRWFEQNRSRYLKPERVSFSHVFFSVDRFGETAARERAVQTLAKLQTMHVARAADRGDAFPGPSAVGSLAPDEGRRLFGESEFTRALFHLPLDRWSGPYRSGYGWHLIYLTDKSPSILPAFEEIKDRVLVDYLEERRRDMNARAFERLRAKYTVRY
jgi:peptidyl-prolyl cis-trans isomerase C